MKYKKWMAIADTHGDMIDWDAANGMLEFKQEFKPDIAVHLGDAFDFRNLRKGASDDEKADSMRDDWDMGLDLLRQYFDGAKVKTLLLGNHDWRPFEMMESSTGLIRDYATDGVKALQNELKRMGASYLPYDSEKGVYRLGHLSMIHGYHAGQGACRLHALYYRNCIFGHVHTIESAPVPSIEPAEARSIGCLCRRDMGYINRSTAKLRWGQGFAYGLTFPDGTYTINQARLINGSYYVATEFKEIKAKHGRMG